MRQNIQRMLIDDDQDCLVLEVELTSPDAGGEEASCHVGYRSCFYREVIDEQDGPALRFIEAEKSFDPEEVYGGIPLIRRSCDRIGWSMPSPRPTSVDPCFQEPGRRVLS